MWKTIWGFLTLRSALYGVWGLRKSKHTHKHKHVLPKRLENVDGNLFCLPRSSTNLQGTAICTSQGTAQPQAAGDIAMEKGEMNVDSWPPKLTHSVVDYSQIVGMDQNPRNTYIILYIYIHTLWLFNIAMENGLFIDGLPIKNGDFPWLC